MRSYATRNPERCREAVYKEAPLKCLKSPPKKRPDFSLVPEALAILSHLGYTKAQGKETIQTAMQAIAEKRPIKNIVTAEKIRDTLRAWRKKYGLPSPEKEGVG